MPEIMTSLPPKAAGEAAELAFMARAAALGLTVSRPLGDNASYDVILGWGGHLVRVQVKSVSAGSRARYCVSAARGVSKRPYTSEEIDFLAACIQPLDAWYIIPVEALGGRVSIHLYPDRPTSCRFAQFRERWDLLTQPATL